MSLRRVTPIIWQPEGAAAASVYASIFGLELHPGSGDRHALMVTGGSTDGVAFFVPASSEPAARQPQLMIEVDDVDEAYERAVRAGAEIIHELFDAKIDRRFHCRILAGPWVIVYQPNR